MKYKVGDKVRIREDLEVGVEYGGMTFLHTMEEYKGKVFTILSYEGDRDWKLQEDSNLFYWNEKTFEPFKRTLRDMKVGDIVIDINDSCRKVIEVLSNSFLVSCTTKYTSPYSWYTFDECEEVGWKLKDEEPSEETVEVLGKKYRKSDIEALEEVRS